MTKTRHTPPDMHNKTRRNAAKPAHNHDVIIVGGGLSGGTLAALLGDAGFHVACVDRDEPVTQLHAEFDGRTTAISWGSQKILDRAGLWASLEEFACAIRQIDILDGGSPVLLQFGAEEVGGEMFGWIVENRLLRHVLFKRMRGLKTVEHLAPATIRDLGRDDRGVTVTLADGRTLSAPLVIGADGRNSFTRDWAGIGVREWSYNQRAVICVAAHEHPHDHIAVEHFRNQGPFAILPMPNGPKGEYLSSVVWTEHCRDSDSALHYAQDVFDAALTARFPDRYGRVRQFGKRQVFPLSLQHAHHYTAPRFALVADAAHGIHPIAGQGLNLGFRDLAALCDILITARDKGDDLGGEAVLQNYERARRVDNMAMAAATDSLNKLFSTGLEPLPVLRKAGLKIVARIPVVKKFFMHQAMGLGPVADAPDAASTEQSGIQRR